MKKKYKQRNIENAMIVEIVLQGDNLEEETEQLVEDIRKRLKQKLWS